MGGPMLLRSGGGGILLPELPEFQGEADAGEAHVASDDDVRYNDEWHGWQLQQHARAQDNNSQ